MLDLPLSNIPSYSSHCSHEVADSVLPHLVAHHLPEKGSRLGEIAIGVVRLDSLDKASHNVWLVSGIFVEGEGVPAGTEGVWLVVRLRS